MEDPFACNPIVQFLAQLAELPFVHDDRGVEILLSGIPGYSINATSPATLCQQTTHLIVEQHVTQHTNHKQEVDPALTAIADLPEVLGDVENLLADTGYFSEANVELSTANERNPVRVL